MTRIVKNSMGKVKANSRVLAHITIKLADGSVADSTKVSGEPSWLIMGDGSFSQAFEANMLGAKIGETRSFELAAKDAFGDIQPDNIHFMEISEFPQDIKLEPGAIVAFQQPNGETLPGIIRQLEGGSVKVDFNHPLAGKNVIFEIEVKQITNHENSTC